MADFFLAGVGDADTTIERQIDALADLPAARLRADLAESWSAVDRVDRARHCRTVSARSPIGPSAGPGCRRPEGYWAAVMAPSWDRFRAVLDADIAHRSAGFGRAGVRGPIVTACTRVCT